MYLHQKNPSFLAQHGQRFSVHLMWHNVYQKIEKRFLNGDQNRIPGDLFTSEGRQKALYQITYLEALNRRILIQLGVQ